MQATTPPVPYWRLSGFYLFYFGSLGVLVPYWGLYLKHLGFGAAEIGELMAVLMATKFVAPNVWGWIADHTGRRMVIIRLAALAGMITFSGVFLGSGYWWLVFVMAAFSFFWNASLPQFEATTMSHLGEHTHRYSSIRLWGSVGFIVTVVALGPILESHGPDWVPVAIFLLFIGLWLSSLIVPEGAAHHLHLEHEPLSRVLRRPEVVALLVMAFLVQASHGPYYTFFTIYLEDVGYSKRVIGPLWALGVIAEIGVFLVMHRLLPRFGSRRLLLITLVLTTLRWLLIAHLPENLPVMLFAQTLHAASFGIYHAVSIHLIHRFFPGRLQGRGQALYSSLSFGLGGAAGNLTAGYLWEGLGATVTYTAAAAASALALLVVMAGIRGRD
jgi:PPP family 3-phenylpropionic acid transporter